MKSSRYLSRLTGLALSCAALLSARAAEKFIWTEGHGDLAANYIDGSWHWTVEEGKPVEDVIIRLNDVARNTIPDIAEYLFLGSPGDPIWVLPATQQDGVPFLGINAEETP